MISVSIDGLFAPTLEDGLSTDQRDSAVKDISDAHAAMMNRREDDVGFYDLPNVVDPEAIEKEAKRLRALADDLVILGIGGSSLGGQALIHALGAERSDRVHFVDNVDPSTFGRLLERLDPTRTAAVVITKSGGTVETLASFLIVRRWFRENAGQGDTRSRMTFVTDPEKGLLRELASTEGIRAFDIPANIGGRFSALTAVGLLPAAFAGVDVAKILEGAKAMSERLTQDDVSQNPAAVLAQGTLLALQQKDASSLVMMPYSDPLRVVSAWFVQLWAESLGKRRNTAGSEVFAGQTPIPAVGATDQHAQVQLFMEGPKDKVVVIVKVAENRQSISIPNELEDRDEVAYLHGRDLGELLEAERRGTRAALLSNGRPVIDIEIPKVDEAAVGGLVMLLEGACALMGTAMGIEPFDQPGVEAGKRMAFGLMGRAGYEAEAERVVAREALKSGV